MDIKNFDLHRVSGAAGLQRKRCHWWADLQDIKAASLLNNDGVYVGAWRDKRGEIHYLRHAGPEHVLCYAPTRSGKGVGLILPTLLSWRESVFVTDLKVELYELTSGWRQKHANNKVLRFEPAGGIRVLLF
jgi:type IV secretion system protein VirD4